MIALPFLPDHLINLLTLLYGARFAMYVLYGYQNRQRLLLYTALTDWFVQPWLVVFTARYGLITYIQQIAFRL